MLQWCVHEFVFKQPQLSLKIILKKINGVAEPPPQLGVVRPPFFIFYFLRICSQFE
jgi:hypothetical protein